MSRRFQGIRQYTAAAFTDAFRERQAHILIGIYLLFTGVITYNQGQRPADHVGDGVTQVFPLLVFLTPLLAMGVFTSSIAEKRTAGSLSIVLGLPIGRDTVLLGTIIGRSLVLWLAILLGMGTTVVLGLVFGVPVDGGYAVLGTLLLWAIGLVFTVFAVCVSALVGSVSRAMLLGLGSWVVFAFQLWDYLPLSMAYIANGFELPTTIPTWVAVVSALNPLAAFAHVVDGIVPALDGGVFLSTPADPAIYERPLVAGLCLCAWILCTAVYTTYRFERVDI